MNDKPPGHVAVLWRGDPDTRRDATQDNNRYAGVFAALRSAGLEAEPAVYSEEAHADVREQLLHVDGVLVWVNPVADGRERTALDDLLREASLRGLWVSTHPHVIHKMGTKEVLVHTRGLGWGSDCHAYGSLEELREGLSSRLGSGAPRVLKRIRGSSGDGVWKIEVAASTSDGSTAPRSAGPETLVEILHAKRGSVPERLTLEAFIQRCEPFFRRHGGMVDQAFQPRLPEGMIRCYLVHDRVVGYGQQLIKALLPPPPEGPSSEAAQPGPRVMYGAEAVEFQRLRASMEREWVPAMQDLLSLSTEQLPAIWDADFLYGPKTAAGEDTYVLCEINVSCVFPFPDQALQPLAAGVLDALRRTRAK